ncbi:MAG: hypothetical protein ACTSPI_07975 [Candidatus Heimdallarchaeaceae archaeon]
MQLEEQLNDWKDIKKLANLILKERGNYRKELITDCLNKIAQYEEKYKIKFYINKKPK